MTQFKLKTAALGIAILGLAMLVSPTSAKAQCAYSSGFSYAPSYGYNQRYYGGYSNAGNPRLRRAQTLATVAGVVIAASNNDNNRNRGSRSHSGGGNRNGGNRNGR